MRRTFLAALGIFLATAAYSQTEPQDEQELLFFLSQQPCASVDIVLRDAENYQEQPLLSGQGLLAHPNGNVYESSMMLFVNQDTGTWSLVALYPNLTACLVTQGSNFQPFVRGQIAQQ